MDVKTARIIAGSLGKPSKMPGHAYGIPARHCPVGAQLVKIKDSVCSSCYALKGRYVFGSVKKAHDYRFASLQHPQWVTAMACMIQATGDTCFRWHDSGDIQGLWHLENIVQVANLCPNVQFWIPTRETKVVRQYLAQHGAFPANLAVRVSATMINGRPLQAFPLTSTVTTQGDQTCPAYSQGGICGACRACWDTTVANVSYPKH